LLIGLMTIGMACGYSKSTMPPGPGTTPVIAQLNPASTTHGGGAFPLEIDGTSFAGNAFIMFSTTKVIPTSASSTKLEAMIPGAAIMNAGTVQVMVTNPGTPGGVYGGGTQDANSVPVNFTIN